jgi:predicted nucleic acid-binding protein
MIVVDTNVIAHLFLTGEHSELSERLLQHDPDWVAPRLWCSEFRNVLTLYLRKNLLELQDSLEILEEAERLMSDAEFEVPSAPVMQLADESGCSAYDCEFVALAHFFRVPLATNDGALLRAFPNTARTVESILGRKRSG